MKRKSISDVKEWVIVSNGTVHQFETFNEALNSEFHKSGNLMTKTYYEYHYSKNV
jgi:hypothetical protein